MLKTCAMSQPTRSNLSAKEALSAFADWLSAERRSADKTVEAYVRDISHFLSFLTGHLGGEPHVADLAKLSRHDVIAWLASRRSQDNLAASSRARAASSLRTFYRFLDRKLDAANAKAMMFEAPRRPHRLPRPLTEDAADGAIDAASEGGALEQPEWVL